MDSGITMVSLYFSMLSKRPNFWHSKQKGMSRSRFISTVLHEKVLNEKERQIKEVYNRVFSDDSIKKEQLETSSWFDGAGNKEGLEW